MISETFLHLLCIDYGEDVVDLIVKVSSCPQSVGVIVYLECAVKLECGCTVVNKFTEVVEPGLIDLRYLILISGMLKMGIDDYRTLVGRLALIKLTSLTCLTLLFQETATERE